MEHQNPELSKMRVSYEKFELNESGLQATPLDQLNLWLREAVDAGPDKIPEPNAMVLSTVNDLGDAHSRTVLLKGLDNQGLTFFTNYQSQKANDLASNPSVSALFPWYSLHRQVIVSGTVTKASREISEAYFSTRPHKSKLGAHISMQSAEISGREVLEADMAQLEEKFPEGANVPLPNHWGGYLIQVFAIEFWQGRRSRLHDRIKFVRKSEGGLLDQADAWQITRLSP